MPTHRSRSSVIVVLVAGTLLAEPLRSVPGTVGLAASRGQLERPTDGSGPRAAAWPRVLIEDPYTREAATRALDVAVSRLWEPRCQRILAEFKDRTGVPLGDRLREFETTPDEYLRMIFFFDGAQHATCRRDGILAFTAIGSRSVYVCGRNFERAWKKNPIEVQVTIIHEMLHSLGLGESPPSARSINDRVHKLCW